MPRDRWADLFDDELERVRWHSAFRGTIADAVMASLFSDHFTDPDLARRWFEMSPMPVFCSHLHRRGITPDDPDRFEDAYGQARVETAAHPAHAHARGARNSRAEATTTRAVLIIVHPHLTREDRDAILDAGLTLDEIDHLIATGAYDRAAIDMMLALRP